MKHEQNSAQGIALGSAAVSSLAPGSAFPQERAVEPALALRSLPTAAGAASAPSTVPRATHGVSGSRATDFIFMLEAVYRNIQEMFYVFNDENKF